MEEITVIQVYPTRHRWLFHMEAAASIFSRFSDLLTLSRIDIYGEPSDELIRRMRQKGSLLGDAAVVEHQLLAGLCSFGPLGATGTSF